MPRAAPHPGKPLFIGAGLLIAAATVVFIGYAWIEVSAITSEQVRVTMPGTERIELKEAGEQSIHWEYEGIPPSVRYHVPIPEIACTMKNPATGHPVDVVPSSTRNVYQIGSKVGIEVLQFNVRDAGPYELTCTTEDDEPMDLLIGHGFVGKVIGVMLLPLLLYFLAVGAAVAMILVGARKKR